MIANFPSRRIMEDMLTVVHGGPESRKPKGATALRCLLGHPSHLRYKKASEALRLKAPIHQREHEDDWLAERAILRRGVPCSLVLSLSPALTEP